MYALGCKVPDIRDLRFLYTLRFKVLDRRSLRFL